MLDAQRCVDDVTVIGSEADEPSSNLELFPFVFSEIMLLEKSRILFHSPWSHSSV